MTRKSLKDHKIGTANNQNAEAIKQAIRLQGAQKGMYNLFNRRERPKSKSNLNIIQKLNNDS